MLGGSRLAFGLVRRTLRPAVASIHGRGAVENLAGGQSQAPSTRDGGGATLQAASSEEHAGGYLPPRPDRAGPCTSGSGPRTACVRVQLSLLMSLSGDTP